MEILNTYRLYKNGEWFKWIHSVDSEGNCIHTYIKELTGESVAL